MLKKYDIPLLLFFSYGIIALAVKGIEYGFFARFYITLWTSAYIFTAIVYLIAGLILLFLFSWRSVLVLAVSAFIQEYTWNIPYTFFHFDIQVHNIFNPFWAYYIIALGLLGNMILYLERNRLRFSRLWIIFGAYYILYLALGMPVTDRSQGFTFPNSIYEAIYVVLCLSATIRSFKYE